MGRLTKRTRRYDNPAVDCGGTYQMFYDPLYPALCKLAHYEDLEEQGRLIELPCAVGDTVWYTDCEDDEKGVLPCTVRNESFACIVKDLWEIKFFATEEEAKAKLKEIEGGKDGR